MHEELKTNRNTYNSLREEFGILASIGDMVNCIQKVIQTYPHLQNEPLDKVLEYLETRAVDFDSKIMQKYLIFNKEEML